MIELNLALTLGLSPPIETNSPYAAASSVPANAIGTPPLINTITYCPKKQKRKGKKKEAH